MLRTSLVPICITLGGSAAAMCVKLLHIRECCSKETGDVDMVQCITQPNQLWTAHENMTSCCIVADIFNEPIPFLQNTYLIFKPMSRTYISERERERDREREIERDRETGRQGDRETGRQGDRETGRQGERERGREREHKRLLSTEKSGLFFYMKHLQWTSVGRGRAPDCQSRFNPTYRRFEI